MLQFVREISISIKAQKALSHRRGFHFHVAAGFAADVAPLSGMVVNLSVVDPWLKELKQLLEASFFETETESFNDVFAEVYRRAAVFLQDKAEKITDATLAGECNGAVTLASLSFREERGFGFANLLMPVDLNRDLEFYCSHFIELLPSGSEARLLKIQTYWRRQNNDPVDYAHESFKLIKPLVALEAEAFLSQLSSIKGHALSSGSVLSRVEIHDLSRHSVLEI